MKIMFADWTIAMAASNARQYDDNVWALDLTGELPEGWAWAALIAQGENLDIIELTLNEAGASAALTAAQLSMDGYYTIQIRGTKGEQVRHTNLVQVFIPRSLSGDATWPTLPTEFSQAEARITAASAHPPIPGEDGYWMIWDVAAGAYKQSDTPVPGGDGGTDLSLGLTSAAVGQIAKITEVDAEGKPTKWEPVDLPSGELTARGWEEFMRFTVDNAETLVFDFSSNGVETLESKKVKQFYLYSPSMGNTGCGTASVLINDCVKVVNLIDFGRVNSGSCKLVLIAGFDTMDMLYFGRDTINGFANDSPALLMASEIDGILTANLGAKHAYKKIYAAQNGIPFVVSPVDYIKKVTVTVAEACSAGVEFAVYVR